MSTTRSSRNVARRLSLPLTGDFFRLVRADAPSLRRDLDLFVAAAREGDDEVLPPPALPGHLLGVEDGVGRLEIGDDTFEPRAEGERGERLCVRDAGGRGESTGGEGGVLRAS